MRKMKCLLLVLVMVLALGLLAGCNDDAQGGNVGAGEVNRLAEVVSLTADATANLQAGDVADIEVTPELKLCFWETGNMDMWFHLPEFDEGEQPTDLADYWYLVRTDNVTGLDENGYLVSDDRWAEVPEGSELGTVGMPMIPVADVNDFVQRHFGDVELQIAAHAHKMYDFDGEYLYAYMDGSLPQGLFDLKKLTAEKRDDGKVVYTARLAEYTNLPYSEQAYTAIGAHMAASAEELTWYAAVTEMVLAWDTAAFKADGELTVKFYIDGDTSDTVYLAADWQ